jgi:hypothetical protein
MTAPDPARALLRHTVATLAYRAAKPLRDAPPEYAAFKASPTSRTPAQILAHMGDLLDWGLSMAHGKQVWNNSAPGEWETDMARFFAALKAFDDYLASDAPLGRTAEVLFQGPVADAMQHTGRLTFLRRLSGAPMKGESYAKAEIVAGRVGTEQTKAKFEFD